MPDVIVLEPKKQVPVLSYTKRVNQVYFVSVLRTKSLLEFEFSGVRDLIMTCWFLLDVSTTTKPSFVYSF